MAYIPIDLDELAPRTDLTPAAKIVMGYLVYRIGANSTGWPGMTTIATDVGIDTKTAKRAVKSLVRAGLIEIENRGRGHVNRYRLSETGVKMSPHWGQNVPTSISESGGKMSPGRVKMSPQLGSKCPPNQIRKRTKKKTTLAQTEQPTTNRPRDLIWDAVCEAFGLKPQTKPERTRVGRVVALLKQKGALPTDILIRLAAYRLDMPNITHTPEGLFKFWDRYDDEQIRERECRKRDPAATDPQQAAAARRRADRAAGEYTEPDRPIPTIRIGGAEGTSPAGG